MHPAVSTAEVLLRCLLLAMGSAAGQHQWQMLHQTAQYVHGCAGADVSKQGHPPSPLASDTYAAQMGEETYLQLALLLYLGRCCCLHGERLVQPDQHDIDQLRHQLKSVCAGVAHVLIDALKGCCLQPAVLLRVA